MVACSCSVTLRVHCDLVTKHKNCSYALQNTAEPQRRDLKRFKMSLFFVPKGALRTSEEWISSCENMVGMRQSNKKKLLKKDGERNFHSILSARRASCCQRETRHADCKKWMSFNAGVILTNEEVHQLRDAGCAIYPMHWIEVDRNAHLRRDRDKVSVLVKYKSRLVGCGNFETTAGLRTDSPAGDAHSHNIACSWCAQAHVSTHACDFTNGYFQGQEIDRILLYRIPAEGIPEEGIAGGAILASRVPI